MKQEDLQKLLDSLDEGPLGTRKDWQWDVSFEKKGNKFSEEHKAKIAAANRGRKVSLQTKEKISITKTGKKAAPFSEEHKAKIAAAHKGKKKPKLSEYHKNRTNPVNQGRDNSRYGKGTLYKEITTGFTGYSYDMKEKYPGWGTWLTRRKDNINTSHFPGLTWVKVRKGDK